jgi:hypothetical protein
VCANASISVSRFQFGSFANDVWASNGSVIGVTRFNLSRTRRVGRQAGSVTAIGSPAPSKNRRCTSFSGSVTAARTDEPSNASTLLPDVVRKSLGRRRSKPRSLLSVNASGVDLGRLRFR